MHSFVSSLQNVSPTIAALLIASIWQGIIITFAVKLMVKLMPKTSAHYRFQVWLFTFLASGLLPVFEFIFQRRYSFAPETLGTLASVDPKSSCVLLDSRWSFVLIAMWLLGVILMSARLLVGMYGVRRLLSMASAAPRELQDRYAKWLQLPGRKTIELLLSDALNTPVATGFFRPSIILPANLMDQLTENDLEQILQHESTHLIRRDDWVALLVRSVIAALPISPALHYIESQLSTTREEACDDAVLAAAITPRQYAGCLARMAENTCVKPMSRFVAGFTGDASKLANRINHILDSKGSAKRYARAVRTTVLVAAAILFVAALQSPSLVAFDSGDSPTRNVANTGSVLPLPVKLTESGSKPVVAHTSPRRHRFVAHRARTHVIERTHEVTVASAKESLPQDGSDSTPSTYVLMWNRTSDNTSSEVMMVVEFTSRPEHTAGRSLTFFQI